MKKKSCPAQQSFKFPFSQQGVVQKHGAKATKKLGALQQVFPPTARIKPDRDGLGMECSEQIWKIRSKRVAKIVH